MNDSFGPICAVAWEDGHMRSDRPTLVSTGEAAAAVGVARNTLTRWVVAGIVKPSSRTAGGHLRWDVNDLQSQLHALEAAREAAE